MSIVEFKNMEVIEKLIIILFSFVSASITFYLCATLDMDQQYPDFIVGNTTWSNSSKIQDLLIVPVTIFVIMVTFLTGVQLFKKLRQSFGYEHTVELSHQLLLWLIPIFIAVFDFFIYKRIDMLAIFISIMGVGTLIAVNIIHSYRSTNISPIIVSSVLFSSILLSIIPLDIALIFGRISPELLEIFNTQQYVNIAYLTASIAVIISMLLCAFRAYQVIEFLPKLILFSQISLPFLFLLLYPSSLVQPNGQVVHYKTTLGLNVFIIAIIFISFFDIIRRYLNYDKSITHYLRLFSPLALFALFIAIKLGTTIVPSISTDDYHFGESLIGWWSYQHGILPYVGYLPAHGIISDDWSLFISSIFFDGTAGSLGQASQIGYAILAFVSVIAMYWFTESLLLAFISATGLCLIQMDYHWLFLVPFICVWLHPKLIVNPGKWLIVWFFSLPIIVLAVPPEGIILCASFGGLIAWQGYQFFLVANSRDWKKITVLMVLFFILSIITPLGEMLFGAIRYVIENGKINQLSYGIPWNLSWTALSIPLIMSELIRMSWVILPIVCAFSFYSHLRYKTKNITELLSIASVFFFVMLLIPYSMGRVDPGSPSRMGIVSVFSWTVLMPITMWNIVPKSKKIFLLYTAMFFPLLIYKTPIAISNIFLEIHSSINTPYLKQTYASEFPNIGLSYVNGSQWKHLLNLKKTIDGVLPSKETYLDLTSRNAHYFYLNRLPITSVTAPYNMVLPTQQKRLISKLKMKLPHIALLEDNNIIHDGGSLSLRDPYLYRFVIDNYTPKVINGFVLGFRKAHTPRGKQLPININIKNLSDVNWINGVSRAGHSLIVNDYVPIGLFQKGMSINFGNNDKRNITKVWSQGRVIYFDGIALSNDTLSKFSIKYNSQLEREYEIEIYSKIYENRNLYKIPVAWGKSYQSLADKMKLKNSLDNLYPNLNDLKKIVNNQIIRFEVKGKDPFLIYNLSQLNISGHDVGFLKFTFTCKEKSLSPEMQVFWWGDNYVGPNEKLSIKFIGYSGVMIIPMDSSPRWLMMDHIKGIRIDLNNASACKSIQIEDIGLYQRSDLVSTQ